MPKTDKQSRALTAAFVASVRNPGKYHDGKGMGLFLLVKPSGARSWVQRVTIRGKRRDIGLGSPPVVTLAEAREVAMDNKRLARSGEDPLAVRQMTHADADLRRGRKGNSQGAFTNLEELEGSRLLPVHFAVLHVSQIWVDAVTRCDRRRPKASHTRCASESARVWRKKQSIAPRLFSEGGLPRAFAQTIPQPHRRWLCRAKIECQSTEKRCATTTSQLASKRSRNREHWLLQSWHWNF